MPKVFSRYDLPPRPRVVCDPEGGCTHQSFKDECDINLIISRFIKTGSWGSSIAVATRPPVFGDFSKVMDFRESMNRLVEAQAEFEALPSRIRARFHNEPEELLDFLADEANRPEAEKLGLLEKKEPPPVVNPPVVNPPVVTAPPAAAPPVVVAPPAVSGGGA